MWSRQTAACLSQVIFVKQLLLSEFFPGIIIIIRPATQSGQFGKGGRKGVHRIPKCVPKHNWQQSASLKIWLTESFHSKLYCQIKCNSTCLKGKVTGNDRRGKIAQKLEITYFLGKNKTFIAFAIWNSVMLKISHFTQGVIILITTMSPHCPRVFKNTPICVSIDAVMRKSLPPAVQRAKSPPPSFSFSLRLYVTGLLSYWDSKTETSMG